MTANVIHGGKVLAKESKILNDLSPAASSNKIITAIFYSMKMAKAISETRKRFYAYSK